MNATNNTTVATTPDAEREAVKNWWLAETNPTVRNAFSYHCEMLRLHPTQGPVRHEEIIELPDAAHLHAWARCQQRRLHYMQRTPTEASLNDIADTLSFAWQTMRNLADRASYPLEPPPPLDPQEAKRMLDPLVNWCTERFPTVTNSTPPSPPPQAPAIKLVGPHDAPVVMGVPKALLTATQYKLLKALLGAGQAGLSKRELEAKAGGDAVNTVKRLAKIDGDWAGALPLPGTPGRRYRIAWVP